MRHNSKSDRQQIEDIGSRKKAEKALKESEEFSKTLLEKAPNPVFVQNPDTSIRYVNPAWEKLTGYSAGEVIGVKAPYPHWPKERADAYLEELLISLGKGLSKVIMLFQKKTGEYFWVELSTNLFHDSEGKLKYHVANWVDITERKRIEEEKQRATDEIQDLYNNAPCGYHSLDKDGIFVKINDTELSWLGYSRDEIIGKKHFVEVLTPESQALFRKDFSDFKERGWLRDIECNIIRKDGSIFSALLNSTAIRNISGEFIMSRTTVYDITERKKAEQALRNSELKFRTFLEQAQDGILLADSKGIVIECNKSGERITGLKREEVVGKYLWDVQFQIMPEEQKNANTLEQTRITILEILKRKQSPWLNTLSEQEIQRVDGTRRTIQSIVFLIDLQDDFMLGTLSRDITELKKAEEQIKYQAMLVDSVSDAIISTTMNSNILSWNKAAETIYGWKQEQVIGKKIRDVLQMEFPTGSMQELLKQLDATGYWVGESIHRRKDGVPLHMSVSISRLKDSSGAPIGNVGIYRDITRLKQFEAALQSSEAKYRSLVNNVKLGIFRSTPGAKGKFLEVNKTMEEITGYSRGELLRTDVSNLYTYPEERGKFIDEVVRSQGKTTRELRFRKKQGTQIIVAITNVAILDDSGQVMYIDGILEDITERKKLEDQLKELYEKEKHERQELEEEAKARGLFINVLGHELRTPLTPIVSSANLLQYLIGHDSSSAQSQLINNLCSGVEVLVQRLDELLDLGRFSRGDITLKLKLVDTASFIQATASRFQPVIQKKDQTLTLDLAEGLPAILADPIRLDQVLVNLLSNASKFSPEGGQITLRARKESNSILVELQDEGSGISPEEQQRLFQPYHRTEQDRHRFPGMGLGLAISRQIVEAHQGRIWVTSQPGQGSTFSFQLPIKSEPEPSRD